jgi:hypothetical protein
MKGVYDAYQKEHAAQYSYNTSHALPWYTDGENEAHNLPPDYLGNNVRVSHWWLEQVAELFRSRPTPAREPPQAPHLRSLSNLQQLPAFHALTAELLADTSSSEDSDGYCSECGRGKKGSKKGKGKKGSSNSKQRSKTSCKANDGSKQV